MVDGRGVCLLLLCLTCSVASVCAGAEAYRLLEQLAGDLDQGSMVEIGSDRGEGSTSWLYHFAKATNRDFFSVDFSEEGFNNAQRACGPCAHRGLGEEFLDEEFPALSQTGKIAFAYLDNYDWVWAGEHPESYTLQFPAMLSDEQLSPYKLKMRKEYREEGLTLNNEQSQKAHLEQAMRVHRLCTERCIILFDDTFPLGGGRFSGKGGAAMAYLLADDRFEIIQQSDPSEPSYQGFAMVRRLVTDGHADSFQVPEGGPVPVPPWAGGGDGGAPAVEWVKPIHQQSVACCSVAASVRVRNAIPEYHTLVMYVDLLERWRRVEWSGEGEDLVSFELAMPQPKRVLVAAHLVGPGPSGLPVVILNSTIEFDFA